MKKIISIVVLLIGIATFSAGGIDELFTTDGKLHEEKLLNKPLALEGTPFGYMKIVKDEQGNYYEIYYSGFPDNISKKKMTIYKGVCLKNEEGLCFAYDTARNEVVMLDSSDMRIIFPTGEIKGLYDNGKLNTDGKSHFDKIINKVYVLELNEEMETYIKIIKKNDRYYLHTSYSNDSFEERELEVYKEIYLKIDDEWEPSFYAYDTKLQQMVDVNLAEGIPYINKVYKIAKNKEALFKK